MSTYPAKREEFLKWCEAHQDIFSSNAAAIGLTPAQATAFKNQTAALRAKTTSQTMAKDAAKAATQAVVETDGDMRELASDVVRSIRTFANNTNNDNVYNIAQIPAPGSGGVVPPPGTPTDFKVELNSDGSITLRWKAQHPEGSDRVVYFVQRKLVGQTAFTLVGGSGERSYQDNTLPIGVDGAGKRNRQRRQAGGVRARRERSRRSRRGAEQRGGKNEVGEKPKPGPSSSSTHLRFILRALRDPQSELRDQSHC